MVNKQSIKTFIAKFYVLFILLLMYSYKLAFELDENAGSLSYMNGRVFTVDNVWFVKEFKEKTL